MKTMTIHDNLFVGITKRISKESYNETKNALHASKVVLSGVYFTYSKCYFDY